MDSCKCSFLDQRQKNPPFWGGFFFLSIKITEGFVRFYIQDRFID